MESSGPRGGSVRRSMVDAIEPKPAAMASGKCSSLASLPAVHLVIHPRISSQRSSSGSFTSKRWASSTFISASSNSCARASA
jgi:hypothetical protein